MMVPKDPEGGKV